MLEGRRVNSYFVSKLLANSDYLCYDKYSCSYLVAQNKHGKIQTSVSLPYVVNAVDVVREENISYICYHLFENVEWIGDLSKNYFLSETFCCTILSNFLKRIVIPIL